MVKHSSRIILYIYIATLLLSVSTYIIGKEQTQLIISNIVVTFVCIATTIKALVRMRVYIHHGRSNANTKAKYLKSLSDRNDYFQYRVVVLVLACLFHGVCAILIKAQSKPILLVVIVILILYIADILFSIGGCILNKLVNIVCNTDMKCCSACPIRGWDIMLVTFPLVLIIKNTNAVIRVMILMAVISAIGSLITWEINKFSMLLPKPNCLKCTKYREYEYITNRKCKRRRIKKVG